MCSSGPAIMLPDFDPKTHTYRMNGNIIPSVTQVLAPLQNYGHINPDVLQNAARRGVAVHLACELDDMEANISEEDLTDEVLPYLMAWRLFKLEYGFEPTLIEQLVHSTRYNYAGTLDRIGLIDGERWLIDIKATYAIQPTTGPQTAAYLAAWNESLSDTVENRGCVQLKRDGTYAFKSYEEKDDWRAFLSCLGVYHWRVQNYGGAS